MQKVNAKFAIAEDVNGHIVGFSNSPVSEIEFPDGVNIVKFENEADCNEYIQSHIRAADVIREAEISTGKAQLAGKGIDQTTIDNLKKVIFNV